MGTMIDHNTEDMFKYELCSYPFALFEAHDSLRPASKAVLADGRHVEGSGRKCKGINVSTVPLHALDG